MAANMYGAAALLAKLYPRAVECNIDTILGFQGLRFVLASVESIVLLLLSL